jgi:AAA domain
MTDDALALLRESSPLITTTAGRLPAPLKISNDHADEGADDIEFGDDRPLPPPTVIGLPTVRLADIEMKSIEWVDRPFLQRGAFHVLAGKKGAGKGTWIARQAARATTGEMFGHPVNVLILASEDSNAIDLKPRIVAAGGDPNRVHSVTGSVLLPDHIPALRATANRIGDVGLIVIDPIGNHLGGANTDSEGAVRDAIAPLNDLADELDAVVLGVRHLSKNTQRGALSSVLGSTAWVDVPRVVLVAAADNEDEMVFHVQTVAGNRGPKSGAGRSYRLELVDVGLKEPVTFAAETGDSAKDVDNLLSEEKRPSGSANARDLILSTLEQHGQMESDQLDALVAEQAGVSAKTVQNLRTGLKNEGLIKSVAGRDEHGAVKRWFVARTNAPLPDPVPHPVHARENEKSVSSSSTSLHPESTHRDLARDVASGRLPNNEVRRLLKTYRPELIGADDITTAAERRQIALLLLVEERMNHPRLAA